MTADEGRLRRLAADVAAALTAAAPNACILLGGSLAAGRADAYSDLDLYVVTARALPQPVRRERLRTLADPRTVPFWDQPVRTGGLADTCRVAGTDVTVCYRRAAEVEQMVSELLAGSLSDPSHEAAYGHELSQAEVLSDPLGLATGWRQRLSRYPADRGTLLAAELTRRLVGAGRRPERATELLAPVVAWSLHRLCAAHRIWFPGSKRRPADDRWSAEARAELAAVGAILRDSGPVSERLTALAARATGASRADDAAVAAALALPDLPDEQWVNLGCDALGGRLQVAIVRDDAFAAAHYLGRAVEAMTALGSELAPLAWHGSPAEARRRLAERWSRELRARGLLNPYAEAALRLAIG